MVLGGGLTVSGAVATAGFDTVSGDRSTRLAVASDANAILGLQNFKEGTVYDEPSRVTVTNQTGGNLTGVPTNKVESAQGDLEFQNPGSTLSENPLALGDLPEGHSREFDVVTAGDESGQVTDTVTITYGDPDRIAVEVTRDITVSFKSGARLVYAVGGNVKVYDAVRDTEYDPPESRAVDVIGANAADFVGPTNNADITFVSSGENGMFSTEVGASSDYTIRGTAPAGHSIKKQKTRLALNKWAGIDDGDGNGVTSDEYLVIYADGNSANLFGMDGEGNTEKIASPSNGAGGVSSVVDFDGDGAEEMVFMDSSQQLRYLEQDGTTTKIQNGSVGANNSAGFGPAANFPGSSRIEVPFIDGSQNPALVDYQGNKTLLNSSGVARKAAVAPVDVDDDGELEFTFLGNSSGKIRYIDNVRAGNDVRTLEIGSEADGDRTDFNVIPDETVALNSGTNPGS
jgi:hypothetical protein